MLASLDGDYPFSEVHETVRCACLEDGIGFLDLRPALSGVPTPTLWVHEVDHHPNELAHARAAAVLRPAVLRRP